MCSVNMPEPQVSALPPPPSFDDEQVALARKVHAQNTKRLFAGLASTIGSTGVKGVTTPGRTTGGASAD